jgi:hypothetical protein
VAGAEGLRCTMGAACGVWLHMLLDEQWPVSLCVCIMWCLLRAWRRTAGAACRCKHWLLCIKSSMHQGFISITADKQPYGVIPHMLPSGGVRVWVVYLTPKIERIISLLSTSLEGEVRCRCQNGMAYKD